MVSNLFNSPLTRVLFHVSRAQKPLPWCIPACLPWIPKTVSDEKLGLNCQWLGKMVFLSSIACRLLIKKKCSILQTNKLTPNLKYQNYLKHQHTLLVFTGKIKKLSLLIKQLIFSCCRKEGETANCV